MSLKLGTRLAVVVSSPETAREMLTTQSHVFVDRSDMPGFAVHGHGEISVVLVPGNSDLWKKLRRISKERLFSARALQLNDTNLNPNSPNYNSSEDEGESRDREDETNAVFDASVDAVEESDDEGRSARPRREVREPKRFEGYLTYR